jgi:short-subunit dehydrogenase
MHVAVTGASAGIGEAIAREFSVNGASVSLIARRRDKLDVIAASVKGKMFVATADLCDVERSCDWIAPAEAALGPIDVLVNNAGVQIVGPTEDMDLPSCEEMLRLDLHTPLRLTRTLLPAMLARRSGTIVDIASMAALTPMPGMFYYNAAKAGLATASEGLRGELRGTGVHVVTVYPGPVETELEKRGRSKYEASFMSKLVPVGTTEGLARLVRRAVERKRARVVYPRFYALTRYAPNLSRWFTSRFSPALVRGT